MAGAAEPTVGVVARRAGVSRLTVYQHFGSLAGLMEAVATSSREAGPAGPAAPTLRAAVEAACERWAGEPALFRRLPAAAEADPAVARALAERLAGEDRLRPGCSLREAEDVIGLVTSFAAFDRIHRDGRRSTGGVAEILLRMAESILNAPS